MKNKKARGIVLIMIFAIMCFMLLAGCQEKSDLAEEETKTSETLKEETKEETKNEEEVNSEPLTIFYQARAEVSLNDNPPIIAAIEEATGIEIEWIEGPIEPDQFTTKFNLTISSGDLPDILSNNNIGDMIKVAQRGLFLPLDDLIESDIPSFKIIMDDVEGLEKALKLDDGNNYFMPLLSAVRPAKIFMVRQDWLDALGLEQPTNLDEFYTVLKAFKDKDPNGNGEADEIPYVTRDKELGLLYIAQSFGLFGFENGFMIKDGVVQYPYVQPEMKEALIYLNKLYSEGLVDKEYSVTDKQSWTAKITNELAGMTYDWFPRVDSFTTLIQETNPNADMSGFVPPRGPSGETTYTESQQQMVRAVTAVSKDSQNVEAAAKLFNFMYSEEGILLTNFGIEGTHYTMVDGTPTYTDYFFNGDDTTEGLTGLYLLFRDGRPDMFSLKADIRFEDAYAVQEVIDIRNEYDKILYDIYPNVIHTQEETDLLSDKYSEIETYTDEMINKFISGVVSLDEFDAFVEELEKMGILEVVSAKQAAYDRYMSK